MVKKRPAPKKMGYGRNVRKAGTSTVTRPVRSGGRKPSPPKKKTR